MKTAAMFRSQLNRTIRSFFDQKGYLEVETPSLSPDLIPEPTIENFGTRFENEFLDSRELYLIPSPEIYMKKLIAQGFGSIYQIGHCFRNSEQIGRHHNPEFSMLEYYSVGMDEQDSVALTEELFASLVPKDGPDHLKPPFDRLTVTEAMWQFAKVDLDKHQSQRSLAQEARRLNLQVPDEPESWEDTFNRIFLTLVEPNLPQKKPLVLDRYPAQIDCLAKRDGNYRKRWEMYAGGVEIANCYDEERDPEKVRSYYRKQYASLVQERANKESVIPDADPDFADIFTTFPQCSGVAMGLDRLQMLLMGESSLEGVILFPFSGTLVSGK
ncbi:amino acid--tRNA ligase-related protein [Sphaerochaeta sp. PS]|uniref:amino acid--tRNA ligase-related protein n=1 Tax=Sphaerochaeta sp. PS TaxID=3076336 RepID=UPI0028A39BE2|nr:amino acid--tRNA ligase-related protein [Sphaerochaeta sp. PS]MDT4761915.1 amino acid--tRNA ligase-related protein [Sphaerochaeta sp. PS]